MKNEDDYSFSGCPENTNDYFFFLILVTLP